MRAGLRPGLYDLGTYFDRYQSQHPDIDITPYSRLCDIAHVYMFFIGHSKSPQQQLPRYEFLYSDALGTVSDIEAKILAALSYCGFTDDHDHSLMAAKDVTYLIPAVTQQAHRLSKDVGKQIDSATGQWIMSRYHKLLDRQGR